MIHRYPILTGKLGGHLKPFHLLARRFLKVLGGLFCGLFQVLLIDIDARCDSFRSTSENEIELDRVGQQSEDIQILEMSHLVIRIETVGDFDPLEEVPNALFEPVRFRSDQWRSLKTEGRI